MAMNEEKWLSWNNGSVRISDYIFVETNIFLSTRQSSGKEYIFEYLANTVRRSLKSMLFQGSEFNSQDF